jgi:hypothetical protein
MTRPLVYLKNVLKRDTQNLMIEIEVTNNFFLEKSTDSRYFLAQIENIQKLLFGQVKLYLFDIILLSSCQKIIFSWICFVPAEHGRK